LTDSDRIAALEKRLQELEDKEAIREVFNTYGFAADTGNAKAYAETFTEDGVFDLGRSQNVGRDAFERGIADPEGFHKQGIESKGSLHTTGAVTIRVDGLRAWAEGPTMVWIRDGATFKVFAAAYNHWDLDKVDGRWEVSKRTARSVGPDRAAQIWTHYQTVL
jgi:uncharacterized protein (TIGR02246 family)